MTTYYFLGVDDSPYVEVHVHVVLGTVEPYLYFFECVASVFNVDIDGETSLNMSQVHTKKRKISCPDCGQKCKPGAGLSTHLRLHCKQKTTDDTAPTEETVSPNDGGNAVQSAVNLTDSPWTPPEIIEAIKLCREFLRRKIVYTGRTENANTFARILPLYQGFVMQNLSFFAEKFGYRPFKNKPGRPKGAMFALFRDEILPPALAQLQVRSDLDSMSTLSGKTQHMKRDVKNSGQSSMRCIVGWEVVNRS